MAKSNGLSRRDFLKGVATGSTVVAMEGVLGCSSSSTGVTSGETTATAGPYDIMGLSYSASSRSAETTAVAPTTPEEYITMKGEGVFEFGVGAAQGELGITPADFLLNDPAWLGLAPVITDIASTEECDVLVIGAGNAGTAAAMRCQELGAKTILAETQAYEEYDEYACDMATYNSDFFLNKGTPEVDTIEVFNEYVRKGLNHVHQKIVLDYATRSGEMLDWLLTKIPSEYIESYAHACNYKGNANFSGICCGQRSFIGMTQWRDVDTNVNMWPFVIRSVHSAFEDAGGTIMWGSMGIVLVQDSDGAVTGAILKSVDGSYVHVNAKAVIVAAGDFGGNPDMHLDLCDHMRNLAWSYGGDRNDVASIGGMGRDGSGVRMCMWAGGTMEAGSRAGQACGERYTSRWSPRARARGPVVSSTCIVWSAPA